MSTFRPEEGLNRAADPPPPPPPPPHSRVLLIDLKNLIFKVFVKG